MPENTKKLGNTKAYCAKDLSSSIAIYILLNQGKEYNRKKIVYKKTTALIKNQCDGKKESSNEASIKFFIGGKQPNIV